MLINKIRFEKFYKVYSTNQNYPSPNQSHSGKIAFLTKPANLEFHRFKSIQIFPSLET